MKVKNVDYNNYDCSGTSEAVCPYCGNKTYIEAEDYNVDEEPEEIQCRNCNKYFVYSTNITVTFNTEPYENYYLREVKYLKDKQERFKKYIEKSTGDEIKWYESLLNQTEKELQELENNADYILGE